MQICLVLLSLHSKNPIASLESGSSRTAVTPEAPIETRRSKRRASLTAEMPHFEPRPAPQATQNRAFKRKAKTAATASARRNGRRIVAIKSTKERNTATPKEITPEPEVDPKISKTEATDLTLNHYSHHTKRLVSNFHLLKIIS